MQRGTRSRPLSAVELVESWREYLSAHGYRPSTVKHYPRIATDWIAFLAARRRAYDNCDYDDVDSWVSLWSGTGRSPWTIRASMSAVRNWYKWLKRRHYVADNPFDCTEPIRAERKLPQPLTEAQAKAIIEGELDVEFRAMWEVFYSTGARISSVMDLRPEDLQLDASRVLFRTAKRGKSRVMPLGHQAVDALRIYLAWRVEELARRATPSEWLWLGPQGRPRMHQDTVRDRLTAAARRVGITERVNVHRWRHSAATHLLDHGADIRAVQEFLDHSSIQATQLYTLVSPTRLETVVRQSHPRP